MRIVNRKTKEELNISSLLWNSIRTIRNWDDVKNTKYLNEKDFQDVLFLLEHFEEIDDEENNTTDL